MTIYTVKWIHLHKPRFDLGVCGSIRTRGYTRPVPTGMGRVGYGYDVHGYTRFYP